MKLRKLDTDVDFNNCNSEYGIETRLRESDHEILKEVVNIIKELKSVSETRYFASAENFLTDYIMGYADASKVDLGLGRKIKKLPTTCKNCPGQEKCYRKTPDKYYWKVPPS